MSKLNLYNQQAQKIGQVNLPQELFGLKINPNLINQVALAQAANQRHPWAQTKDRAERRGGGRKPWRQKGTGRARHGSIRSPLWRGGGVAFGPSRQKVFSKKVNKKAKRLALLMVLSSKLQDKEIILLDKLELSQAKTKLIRQILEKLFAADQKDFNQGALVVLPQTETKIIRSLNNLPKFRAIRADSLNVLDLLKHKYLLLIEPAIKVIAQTYL